MARPYKQVSDIDVDLGYDFGYDYGYDKEPVPDAAFAALVKAHQERVEGKQPPVPPNRKKSCESGRAADSTR